jgi:hypothetical protein
MAQTLEEKRAARAARMRQWRIDNPEKMREYQRNYNAKNRARRNEASRLRMAKQYAENPARAKALRVEYIRKNPDTYKRWREKYADTHWPSQCLLHARQHTKTRNASGRSHSVTIFPEYLRYLWSLQGGKCYWSDLPLSTKQKDQLRVSLDRLDNTKGYEIGNVVLTAWCINRFRGDMSPEDFRAMLWRLREGS